MRFGALLAELEQRIVIPYPERAELLGEARAHLDALYADFRTQGLTEIDAELKAVETFAADSAFIAQMRGIHRPRVETWLAKLPPSLAYLVEVACVPVLGVAIVLLSLVESARFFTTLVGATNQQTVFTQAIQEEMMNAFLDTYISGGIFMHPITLAGIASVCLLSERVFSLWLKKDHSAGNIERRLSALAYLVWAPVFVAAFATFMGLNEAVYAGMGERTAADLRTPLLMQSLLIAFVPAAWGSVISFLAYTAKYIVQAKVERIKFSRASAVAA